VRWKKIIAELFEFRAGQFSSEYALAHSHLPVMKRKIDPHIPELRRAQIFAFSDSSLIR